MRCWKHRSMQIPCLDCMLQEYIECQKFNDDLIRKGQNPKHDLTQLEGALREKGLIP